VTLVAKPSTFAFNEIILGHELVHLGLQRGLVGSGLSGNPCLQDRQRRKQSRKVVEQRIQGRQKAEDTTYGACLPT
jgi:hypothetical protein